MYFFVSLLNVNRTSQRKRTKNPLTSETLHSTWAKEHIIHIENQMTSHNTSASMRTSHHLSASDHLKWSANVFHQLHPIAELFNLRHRYVTMRLNAATSTATCSISQKSNPNPQTWNENAKEMSSGTNAPFSKNFRTNIGSEFLYLIGKHYPNHKLMQLPKQRGMPPSRKKAWRISLSTKPM